MKKYLFIILLVGVWGCEDDNSDNVECVEIVQTNDSKVCWVDCDYLQL